MSIRQLLGLCDHKWKPLFPGQIVQTSRIRVVDSKKFITGYVEPRECEKCGTVRSFRLS